MGLREGYRQTEVGVLPEDWEVKPFSSVIRKTRLGGNYPNQDTESEFPLMKMGNVGRGHFDISKTEYIKPGVIPENQHRLISEDVLFNTRNTLELVGKVAIWRDELPVAFYNSNLMRLEFEDREVCSNEYANYALNTSGSITRLRGLATGTTSVAAIYTRDLAGLAFIVPPKIEQRAIATALSDADALLDGLDRLIAKKRDIKQAAMQQLLTGKTRLPGFEGEWEVKRLGDHGAFLKGSGIKKEESQSGEIPCVRYGELYTKHHEYIKSYYSFITPTIAKTSQLLRRGDILFAGSGETKEEIGKCVALLDKKEVYAGGDVVIFRPEGIDPLYLGFCLNAPALNRQKAGKGQGDAVVHISASALADLIINIPSDIQEQVAIAAVLKDIDAEIEALEQRRTKTRDLKKAVMQELLTGRTRLV